MFQWIISFGQRPITVYHAVWWWIHLQVRKGRGYCFNNQNNNLFILQKIRPIKIFHVSFIIWNVSLQTRIKMNNTNKRPTRVIIGVFPFGWLKYLLGWICKLLHVIWSSQQRNKMLNCIFKKGLTMIQYYKWCIFKAYSNFPISMSVRLIRMAFD